MTYLPSIRRCFFAIALLPVLATAQSRQLNLPALLEQKAIKTVNRTATISTDASHKAVHLDEQLNPGVAWLTGYTFSNGTLSFDVKGKDLFQQSFVGIAFHGINDTTYDAVYFRPFNFHSPDAVRKTHAVQYISLPANDWPKLREEHPNQYEQAIVPAPDPNAWFHVRIVVNNSDIAVYVNNNSQPSLQVKKLSSQTTGMLGLWAGNGSGGDWANLVISAAK